MKQIISKIKEFYNKGENKFYFSLLGPLIMGTVHLIAAIMHFDWTVVNYCIFSYLLALFKLWQWAIEKFNFIPKNIMAGIISMVIIIAPMIASFIMTIMFKDAPHYIFDWLVYAYATYGTIKMVLAIKSLVKKEKSNREYVNSYFGLIGALYTIQMMEFRLIMFASNGEVTHSMFLMQLFTQGAIFIVSIIIIILFIRKYIRDRHESAQMNG